MINLSFVRGSTLRRVSINKRVITFLTPELGNKPLTIDLDKINEGDFKDKITKEQLEQMREIAKLETEDEMALDLKRDFQREGWRQFKKQ